MFEKGDRILVHTSPYSMKDNLGTVLESINEDSFRVQIDEDKSVHEVHEDKMCHVREDVSTKPSDCNYQLTCKNCGWDGGAHVPFAPHYCREKVIRKSLMDRNEQLVPTNSVFEAHTIMPIPSINRFTGQKITRKYAQALKTFDPSTLGSR